MPVIIVYGFPGGLDWDKDMFIENLREAVVSVEELENTKDQVSVFLVRGQCGGTSKDIIIFVEGLFKKPERTKEVKNKLAAVLVAKTEFLFPDSFVECFVKTFDPEQGYYSSRGRNL